MSTVVRAAVSLAGSSWSTAVVAGPEPMPWLVRKSVPSLRRLRASSAYCGSSSTSLAMASARAQHQHQDHRAGSDQGQQGGGPAGPAVPLRPAPEREHGDGEDESQHHRRDDLRAQPDPRCRHHRRSGAEQEDEPPAQPRRGAGGGLRPRADRAGSRHGPTVGPTRPRGPRPRRMRRAGRPGVIVGQPGRRPGSGGEGAWVRRAAGPGAGERGTRCCRPSAAPRRPSCVSPWPWCTR